MSTSALQIAYGSYALPLKISSLELPCFILSDQRRVFSIGGIQKLLGYEGKSETWLLNILNSISKFEKLPKELLEAYEHPIKTEIHASKTTIETLAVIDSNLFIDTCKIVVDAKNKGLLGANLIKISKPAAILLAHTKDQNIDTFIDAATGYLIYKESVKQTLTQYMHRELEDDAVLWLNTISESLYHALFQIHNQDWHGIKSNPEIMGALFYDLVFCRINASLLFELRAKTPKRMYQRKGNRPQNNENKGLTAHVADLIGLIKTADYNWFIFLQLLNRTYPVQNHYSKPLLFKSLSPKKAPLSNFNNHLKKLT